MYRNRYLINLEMYADIKAEKDADNEKVAQERFANHIAKEEGKYQVALEKARQKAVHSLQFLLAQQFDYLLKCQLRNRLLLL